MIPTLINAHIVAFIVICWTTLGLTLVAAAGWLWQDLRPLPRAPQPARAKQPPVPPPPAPPVPAATPRARRWALAFFALLALTVISFRQPTLWRSGCLQIDASCVLVAAQMLQADPVPFRGCTVGIHGPLEAYTLMPFYWAGMPPTPPTARLYALLCVLVMTLGTGVVLARYGGPGAAVPGALAVGLWAAFAKELNSFEWNSEYLPVALMAVAVWLYARGRQARRWGPAWLAGAGFLLGAVAYSKLQAVPSALVLTLVGLVELTRGGVWAGRRWPALAALITGGLALPILFTSITTATHTWPDFTLHYLGFAESYGTAPEGPLPLLASLSGGDTPWLLLFAVVLGLSFLLLAGWRGRARPPQYGWWLSGAGGYVLAALFSINLAHMGFHHYAILLILPTAVLLGLVTGPAWRALIAAWRAGRRTRPQAALLILGLAVVGWCLLFQFGTYWQVTAPTAPLIGSSPESPAGMRFLPIATTQPIYSTATHAMAVHLKDIAEPHDQLAVWGWAPHYFLESGLTNATRYLITVGQMAPNTWVRLPPASQAFYRACFMADLTRHRPEFFIDAVSSAEFAFHERAIYGHETWPELGQYIAANYLLASTLESGPGDATRVYLRKDLQGTRGTPPPLPPARPITIPGHAP